MASGGSLPVITGGYVGTGAAKTIVVGFKPKAVVIINQSDPALAIHLDTMAALAFLSQEDGATAYTTTQGVTLTDTGFTVGTDVQINAAADVFHYLAIA